MNSSENQLKGFLESRATKVIHLTLRPQGDYTAISAAEVNICEVEVNGNTYIFGGISEAFYDKMVNKYDWRDKQK